MACFNFLIVKMKKINFRQKKATCDNKQFQRVTIILDKMGIIVLVRGLREPNRG